MDTNKFMDADIQDLIRNPTKYGAPTLKEFSANPDRWRKSKEHLFNMIDNGSKQISGIQKIIVYIDGVKCNSPEHAQRVMEDMGLEMNHLEPKPELEDIGNHKAILHCYLVLKPEFKSKLILPEGT